ncbi:MAG: NAD-dependent dihydropyrimidine dehydrogenase subunit PreA [Spirochaetia bacterium]|jgi:dihydropyrimidine dehydrogenase (NAD+) subunit PreA|nr:NAD-dependent dihydropyrimidine dehydrogenase subunit PreA [Spirochaetia bacterium]
MDTSIFENKLIVNEADRCLLCSDAPCTAACGKSNDPAQMLLSLRFENARVGGFFNPALCADCNAGCEKSCLHYDFPIRIKKVAAILEDKDLAPKEADLSCMFLNVRCENPFLLSSSVVASNYEMCRRALEMGWAGVVFKTIGFLVPHEVSPRFSSLRKESTPFVGFGNLEQIAEHSLEENLKFISDLKRDFPKKVMIVSIMGQSDEEWTELAKLSQQAGADMIECNFSCPHMSGDGLGSDVGQKPELVKHYTQCVRKGTDLPILAKMTPNLAHMEIPAIAAVEGGADGIAAINTIKSLSGVDLNMLSSSPVVHGMSSVSGYSGKAIKPIALRFISDLAQCEQLVGIPISGMGGVETWRDALEFIALGCTTVQVTTAVMQYGYRIIDDLKAGLSSYMYEHRIGSVAELIGLANEHIVPTDELDRNTIMFPSFHLDKCLGCGRCYISCRDAGHQAITFDAKTRKPKLIGNKCVGCHLCRLVCPAGAIGKSKRIPKQKPHTQEVRA